MENLTIQCSTKVCSFGKQVVEKVERDTGRYDAGRYLYRITRSPMCEYMINFILKVRREKEGNTVQNEKMNARGHPKMTSARG